MGAPLGGSDDEPISAINVVPFVDIILVVLIIFMVTAPMVLRPTIDIELPQAATGEEAPPTPLMISVFPDGRFGINGEVASLEEIAAQVSAEIAERPETPAILEADKNVTLETLTELIDLVKSAGVSKVAFSIDRKSN